MACSPSFDSSVPFECIRDIVASVRGGGLANNRLGLIRDTSWTVGCSVEALGGGGDIALATNGDLTPEQCCDELEKLLPELTIDGGTVEAARGRFLPPEVLMLLLQLLRSLLNQ